MKRGTPDHPKTLALQSALACSRAEAVGILELLWHWTARYAPAGDVGRWTNGALAVAIGWAGNPDEFVAALVAARWLDESADCRLYVHDWAQHADDAVHLALYRSLRTFADGTMPRAHRLGARERERLELAWDRLSHVVRTESAQCVLSERTHERTAPPEPRPALPRQSPAPPTDLAAPSGTAQAVSSRVTWLTPYADAWTDRWGPGSKPPAGEMAKSLSEAELELQGDRAECVARWRRFLAASERSQFARPARFLQGLGEWAEGGARASPGRQRGVTPGNVEAVKQYLERGGRGDAGQLGSA